MESYKPMAYGFFMLFNIKKVFRFYIRLFIFCCYLCCNHT